MNLDIVVYMRRKKSRQEEEDEETMFVFKLKLQPCKGCIKTDDYEPVSWAYNFQQKKLKTMPWLPQIITKGHIITGDNQYNDIAPEDVC